MLTFSCEKFKIYDCSNCLDEMPYEVKLTIRLKPVFTIDEEGYNVSVYKGKVDDKILIDERRAREDFFVYGLVNQEYSAIAWQIVDGVKYNIVSGTTIKVVSQDDFCEDECYIVTDNEIDLRKKFN